MTRVAVDWDGTCIVDDTWPNMGEWEPDAIDALWALAEEYDEVVIWSCRTAPFERDETTPRDNRDQVRAITTMLDKAGLPDNVWVWTRPYKPPAKAYVDNRAVHYDGDWKAVMRELDHRRSS